MEPPPARPPAAPQGLGFKAALACTVLTALSLVALWRADTLEADLLPRLQTVETRQREAEHKIAELEEDKQLLTRAVQAESRLEAVREELDRVYAQLQGKKYTKRTTTTLATTTTTKPAGKQDPPIVYKDCGEKERQELCMLAKDDDELAKRSKVCAQSSISIGFTITLKQDKFASCLQAAIPGLSEKCAMCFAGTADYGVRNCKMSCRIPSPSCDKCMQGHAEDAKRCMGFMMPGYALPDQCPAELLGG